MSFKKYHVWILACYGISSIGRTVNYVHQQSYLCVSEWIKEEFGENLFGRSGHDFSLFTKELQGEEYFLIADA
jgi:hypothetical protein